MQLRDAEGQRHANRSVSGSSSSRSCSTAALCLLRLEYHELAISKLTTTTPCCVSLAVSLIRSI
jgi:hypothetical protein